MNNYLKLAYDAGARQALIDAGLTKTAFLGELYDDAVEATSRGIGSVAGLYDDAVDTTYRGIKDLDNEFKIISNRPDVRPAKAVGNPGTPALRKARDDNMRYHSDRIYAQDRAADKKILQGMVDDGSLLPGGETYLARPPEREALVDRGRRLDAALARNNRTGNPARTPGALDPALNPGEPSTWPYNRWRGKGRTYGYSPKD